MLPDPEPVTLPKLCRAFTPHIESSALYVYSVHHFPTSCCNESIRLLPLVRAVSGDGGSEIAATIP